MAVRGAAAAGLHLAGSCRQLARKSGQAAQHLQVLVLLLAAPHYRPRHAARLLPCCLVLVSYVALCMADACGPYVFSAMRVDYATD